jgi:hypothetical protein
MKFTRRILFNKVFLSVIAGVSYSRLSSAYEDNKSDKIIQDKTLIDNVISGSSDNNPIHGLLRKIIDPLKYKKYPSLNVSNWRSSGNVLGWGADPTGVTDSTESFIEASNDIGEGGMMYVPSGNYKLRKLEIVPLNIVGEGQGATILNFNNEFSSENGIVFSSPKKYDIEMGLRDLSIRTVNGNGRAAVYTPRGKGLNNLRPKITLQRLSFFSISSNDENEGFSQVFSWQWILNIGDSWQASIDDIDAVGSYKPSVDPKNQFLDGFIRTSPIEGILSLRVRDITTHNIANCFEVKQKTYFSLTNVDFARSLRGVYDAPDRVFEKNNYAYGESVWTNVIINSQLSPIDLSNRFYLVVNGLAIHRASGGFKINEDWVGIKLTRPRVCMLQGVEISCAKDYEGGSVGVFLDGGDSVSFQNLSLGMLKTGIKLGKHESLNGPNHGAMFGNISIYANCDVVFDCENATRILCNGLNTSSVASVKKLYNIDDINAEHTFLNINGDQNYIRNSMVFKSYSSQMDSFKTKLSFHDGFEISSLNDIDAIEDSFFSARRNNSGWNAVNITSGDDEGSKITLNSPFIEFNGNVRPGKNNNYTHGTASNYWLTSFMSMGVVTVTDSLQSKDFIDISEKEKLIAKKIKRSIKKIKSSKGNGERENGKIRFLIDVKSLEDIFEGEGLDAHDYGFFYNETIKNNTNSHEVYGIRYEELLAFVIASS